MLAYIAGYLLYRLTQKIFDKILEMTMGLKRVRPLDEFFLFEREGVPSSAGAIFELKKCDFKDYRAWARTKHAENFPCGKCKLRQIMGNFYHQEMSKEEFDSKFD